MSWYRQQLEEWLRDLDVKADTVIDWGGIQNPVGGRTKSWNVENYEVWDLPAENIEEYNIPDKADMIFCLEVFEYLTRPLEALHNIKDTLKPGGKAYVTFAFVYPHHNELDFDSLRYTETGVRRLAKTVGLFTTNTWYRTDKSGILKSFYAADGMRAAKEYPDHGVTGFIVEFTK